MDGYAPVLCVTTLCKSLTKIRSEEENPWPGDHLGYQEASSDELQKENYQKIHT